MHEDERHYVVPEVVNDWPDVLDCERDGLVRNWPSASMMIMDHRRKVPSIAIVLFVMDNHVIFRPIELRHLGFN